MIKLPPKREFLIPEEIKNVSKTLKNAGFEAYIVGGCVRDLIIGKKPKDWDLTTNATPEEIIAIFPDTHYENKFGTVGVHIKDTEDETLRVVEVTPYRVESGYSDFRRPDNVTFSKNIEDDLKRRDFTINAIAYDIEKKKIIDLYKGQEDIKDKIIRSVGNPMERFYEDGLRMMRAVRFHAEHGFKIEPITMEAIKSNSFLLEKIAEERIKDEFSKIIMSDNPEKGMLMLKELNLLQYVLPEMLEGVDIEQNQAHSFDVFQHISKTLQHTADKKMPFHVRLAGVFHDIGKPRSRRFDKERGDFTFHGHEVIGARMAEKRLNELKFSRETVDTVTKLVRWHMFFSDTEQITLSAVRRMIANVGKDLIWDLMSLRMADRIGTGRPKEDPYRLRKYKAMVEEAMIDPVSVGMLKIDGTEVISVSHETPGPKIGYILHALLEEVLEDPKLNTEEYLEKRAVELAKLSIDELKKLGEQGKIKKEEELEKKTAEIKGKYFVK